MGANGKGKSTLLRIIAGSEPISGERIPGHNVVTSFYAQHQLESLNLDYEILDELKTSGSGRSEVELRSLLGCFLFNGDDVFKKIRILSGGEKARVALAKTIISQANFMLLDEPTNHLDMLSVQMLIDALNKYEGSFVLVSHDRYFVSQTANKIWEIVNGEIKEFKGTYAEWEEFKRRQAQREQQAQQQAAAEKKAAAAVETKKKEAAPAPVKGAGAIDKDAQKELQKQQKQFSQIESQLASLNTRKAKLEGEMGDPGTYADPKSSNPVRKSMRR
ncbi:ATP-binding cassette domain-containing protein [Chitinophaga sedimenti]|uniref:ATP-binding cassette domain-containing protein n=1 Tax=Chitinophaga sedimenti TaxID=2033606 RepID=UPI002005A876|nr:ATP-binding cassette domain-containing protein [Chitinophaga sedimenti]MCK7555231.1 ATP-binding cassette domain-containing protein [Chitinophaga sedimenti]